jgi:prepilin-type N-terminal cleavage/methylation domain-containing protein
MRNMREMREKGFTLLEVLVSLAILSAVMAVTLGALNTALTANEAVTDMADMQDNLRAGMNLMERDIVQAGSAIPLGGILVPFTNPLNNPGGSPIPLAINRPSPPGQNYAFPVDSALTSVEPGFGLGPVTLGNPTDMITVIYADNELLWSTMGPINNAPAVPPCAGTVTLTSVTLDTVTPFCQDTKVFNTNVAVQPGDLMMLTNGQGGNILRYVTSFVGKTLNFGPGDPFGINNQAAASGTMANMETLGSNPVAFPPTSISRVWMVTYYLDTTTNPQRPQLMRQINFRQAQAVGQVMENLQISYDIVSAVATPNPVNTRNIIAPDSPSQIRKINLLLSARSENVFSKSHQYFRDNLYTQIGLRSLSFQNLYN